jgi:hypothetical protein
LSGAEHAPVSCTVEWPFLGSLDRAGDVAVNDAKWNEEILPFVIIAARWIRSSRVEPRLNVSAALCCRGVFCLSNKPSKHSQHMYDKDDGPGDNIFLVYL